MRPRLPLRRFSAVWPEESLLLWYGALLEGSNQSGDLEARRDRQRHVTVLRPGAYERKAENADAPRQNGCNWCAPGSGSTGRSLLIEFPTRLRLPARHPPTSRPDTTPTRRAPPASCTRSTGSDTESPQFPSGWTAILPRKFTRLRKAATKDRVSRQGWVPHPFRFLCEMGGRQRASTGPAHLKRSTPFKPPCRCRAAPAWYKTIGHETCIHADFPPRHRLCHAVSGPSP